MTLDIVTLREAAQLLGVSRQRWHQLTDSPKPIHTTPVIYDRAEVVEYVQRYIDSGRSAKNRLPGDPVIRLRTSAIRSVLESIVPPKSIDWAIDEIKKESKKQLANKRKAQK
jgi:predicted DNA-binding transcriptional regulator AlpA